MDKGLVALSQGASCGSEDIVLTVGTEATVQCMGLPNSFTLTPDLPKGLALSEGSIHGTPSEGAPLRKYTITRRGRVYGTFTLGGLSIFLSVMYSHFCSYAYHRWLHYPECFHRFAYYSHPPHWRHIICLVQYHSRPEFGSFVQCYKRSIVRNVQRSCDNHCVPGHRNERAGLGFFCVHPGVQAFATWGRLYE